MNFACRRFKERDVKKTQWDRFFERAIGYRSGIEQLESYFWSTSQGASKQRLLRSKSRELGFIDLPPKKSFYAAQRIKKNCVDDVQNSIH